MNILYIHGLDSSLNQSKRAVLADYGDVFAPDINYREDPHKMQRLIAQFKNQNIAVVIGSSMGGFMGYHLADAFQVPTLVFNPALAYSSVPQEIVVKDQSSNLKQIVLGAQDETVNPTSTLKFLAENIGVTNYDIRIRQDLAHQIPLEIFTEEVERFFKALNF